MYARPYVKYRRELGPRPDNSNATERVGSTVAIRNYRRDTPDGAERAPGRQSRILAFRDILEFIDARRLGVYGEIGKRSLKVILLKGAGIYTREREREHLAGVRARANCRIKDAQTRTRRSEEAASRSPFIEVHVERRIYPWATFLRAREQAAVKVKGNSGLRRLRD